MIKIFSKNKQELKSDIDTWIVEWVTYETSFTGVQFPNVKKCYQAFTDKNEACSLKDRLNEAMMMIGISSLPKAKLYKQNRNSME